MVLNTSTLAHRCRRRGVHPIINTDVRYWRDCVAKLQKGAAANFPPKNENSDNRRLMGPQTRYQNRLRVWRMTTWSPASIFKRRACGPENLSPVPAKEFCNTIGGEAENIHSHGVFRILPSRPGEFHPEPLTDPDLNLSIHPARAID